jgi:hypothetical protein
MSTNISRSATPIPSTPATATPSIAIPILKITTDLKYASNDSPPSLKSNPHRLSVPSLSTDEKRSGRFILTDHSGSSEETGFDTDTADELLPSSINDPMNTSTFSLSEASANELNTEVINLEKFNLENFICLGF